VDDPLPLKIRAQSDTPPFEHDKFDQYPTVRPELVKKVQLALIGS